MMRPAAPEPGVVSRLRKEGLVGKILDEQRLAPPHHTPPPPPGLPPPWYSTSRNGIPDSGRSLT